MNAMNAKLQRLLTLAEAARELDIAPGTLRAAVQDRNQLPAPQTRVGRRDYYDAEGLAKLAEAVAAGRELGYFPRASKKKDAQ
jgi:hypothetical protein